MVLSKSPEQISAFAHHKIQPALDDACREASSAGEGDKQTFAFTIGCFDLLHRGHRKLFARMREHGNFLVVGVHDDASICKLKNRAPIHDTATRIRNVSEHVDFAYVIGGTDPTPFIARAINEVFARHPHAVSNSVYVRGDDMPRFPARDVVESHMPVVLLPYTQGVSSTLIRKDLLAVNPELERSVVDVSCMSA